MASVEPLTFGLLLKRHRRAADLTQEALAARAGYSATYISMLERGERAPHRATAELLAGALGLEGSARTEFVAAGRRSPRGLVAAGMSSARGMTPGSGAAGEPVTGFTVSAVVEPSAEQALAKPMSAERVVAPPSGTVTFLFSEIDRSTHPLRPLGERDAAAVARYQALMRTAFAARSGYEVEMQGERCLVAFGTATDALAAAAQAQRALAAEPWPEGVAVRVRMGLHTGAPQLVGARYVGLDMQRAARIASAGHGDQVLLSEATAGLVRDELPAGASLRDLGRHRLPDLREPERLFQLCLDGLPSAFPPLVALDAGPHNLPIQPTPLLDREQDLLAVCAFLRRDDVRLVTLTGPGGVGKTRLGMQVASELEGAFADGVWFIRLSPLTDPAFVLPTIAQTFELPEVAGRPVLEVLREYLWPRQLLLLLDNFEHVLAAAPQVAGLLEACPALKVLVTSRERLHLSGEREYPVPPLALPASHEPPALVHLVQYAAVALFVQRAEAVQPNFAVTHATAPVIADIAVRLEGLPLAIELAAARVKVLSPPALLKRLDRRLAVLTGGPRDVPERQQTMQRTIAWSYDLLTPAEQCLFRRLGVFVGGCTLEAAEAVCTYAGGSEELHLDILEGLGSLVDKSLVQQREEGDQARFGMLQVIREFSVTQLEASGEADMLRQAHCAYYLALVEQGELGVFRPDQLAWRARLDRELDNLRAALGWARAHGATELGLRLAGVMFWYWDNAGLLTEGRTWLEDFLALAARPGTSGDAVSPATRAKALFGAGRGAVRQGDSERGVPLLEQSVALARKLPGWVAGLALNALGVAAVHRGDLVQATAYFEESLEHLRPMGDAALTAVPLGNLSEMAYLHGDLERATAYCEEALALARRGGDQRGTALSLLFLASVARRQGTLPRAAALGREALMLMRAVGGPHYLAECLDILAEIAGATGQGARAARLLGASATVFETSGIPLPQVEREDREAAVAAVRAALGEEAWAAAYAAGRALPLEEAIAEALGEESS